MRRRKGGEVVVSMLLAAAAGELANRILKPRQAPREPAPVALEAYFTPQEIQRGRRFARPQMAIGLTRSGLDLAALALVAQRPPKVLERLAGRPIEGGAAAGAGLAVALSLPSLPLAAVARRRAMKVGLATQSWRGWGVDLVKASAIQAVMSAAAGGAAVAIIRRFPRYWWLAGAGGSAVVGAGLTALAPVVLEPLFNDFTPLPEGETRSDVLELAAAAGVKVREVYSVDASRRTTAANAYVSGLGPTKRVVLFDTLLDRYNRDEVRTVVAHELAHVRHRDVPRGVAYAAIVALPSALAVDRLARLLGPEEAIGTPSQLPALALAAVLVSAPLGLLGLRLSRAMERRADDFSLELSDSPDAFISFERTIAHQNVADLDPPRWVSRLLASHPPTLERIGAAVAYAGENRAA